MAYLRTSRARGVYRRRRYEPVVNRRKYYAPSYTTLKTVQLDLIDAGATVYAPTVTPLFDTSSDAFNRTVSAGSWGTADTGGDWDMPGGTNDSHFAVNTTDGGTVDFGPTSFRFVKLPQTQRGDTQRHTLEVKLITGGLPSGASEAQIFVGVRKDAASDLYFYYSAQVKFKSDNTVTINLHRELLASDTELVADTATGLTWVADHFYRIEVEAEGYSPTTLRARVWDPSAAGGQAGWQVTTTDSSAQLQTVGGPYIQFWNPGGSTTLQASVKNHGHANKPTGQTLTVGLIDGGATVFSPTVVGGTSTQTVTLGLVNGSATVFAPSPQFVVALGLVNASATVFAPQLNLNVALGLIDGGASVFAPTVLPQPVTVTVGLVNGSAAVFAPTPQFVIALGLINASASVFAPQINLVVTVPLVDGAATTYSPTVLPQAVTVTVGLIDSGPTVFSPALIGKNTLTVGLIDSGPAVFAPTLLQAQFVTLGLVDAAATVYAPTLAPKSTVTVGLVDAGATVFDPTLVGKNLLTVGIIDSGPTVFALSLQQAQFVTLGFINASAAVFAPTLTFTVTLGLVDAAGTVYALQVKSTQFLTLGFTDASPAVFAPTLAIGVIPSQDVTVGLIDHGPTTFDLTVTAGPVLTDLPFTDASGAVYDLTLKATNTVDLGQLDSGATVYAPALDVIAPTITLPMVDAIRAVYNFFVGTGSIFDPDATMSISIRAKAGASGTIVNNSTVTVRRSSSASATNDDPSSVTVRPKPTAEPS
jgi:hypothetical protein